MTTAILFRGPARERCASPPSSGATTRAACSTPARSKPMRATPISLSGSPPLAASRPRPLPAAPLVPPTPCRPLLSHVDKHGRWFFFAFWSHKQYGGNRELREMGEKSDPFAWFAWSAVQKNSSGEDWFVAITSGMPPPKAVPFLSVFIRVIREIRGLLLALTLVARARLASRPTLLVESGRHCWSSWRCPLSNRRPVP